MYARDWDWGEGGGEEGWWADEEIDITEDQLHRLTHPLTRILYTQYKGEGLLEMAPHDFSHEAQKRETIAAQKQLRSLAPPSASSQDPSHKAHKQQALIAQKYLQSLAPPQAPSPPDKNNLPFPPKSPGLEFTHGRERENRDLERARGVEVLEEEEEGKEERKGGV